MLSLIFIVCAAVSNAIMDKLQFHFERSVFASDKTFKYWWDPKVSWRNKYKDLDPSKGEKFLGSTTVFVFVTDAWHFFQFVFLSMLFLAIVSYTPLEISNSRAIDFVIFRIVYGIIFQLSFKYIYEKDTTNITNT